MGEEEREGKGKGRGRALEMRPVNVSTRDKQRWHTLSQALLGGGSPPCPLFFFSFLLSVKSCLIGLFQTYLFGKHEVPAVYQTQHGVLCIYQSPEPSWQSQPWTPFHRETTQTQRDSVSDQGHPVWLWQSQILTAPVGLYLSGRAFVCLCQGSVPSCPLEWWSLYSRDSANICMACDCHDKETGRHHNLPSTGQETG